jgi:diketogulonate reductase-like aldo/keto reductase
MTCCAVARLRDLDLIRRIGVANLTIAMIERLRSDPDIPIQPYMN